jgi:hypothetical protein
MSDNSSSDGKSSDMEDDASKDVMKAIDKGKK